MRARMKIHFTLLLFASCSSGSEIIATGFAPTAIAIDGASVYWTDLGDWTIRRDREVLASRQRGPVAIAVDARSVYWVNQGDGSVMKIDKAGGSPVVLASRQNNPIAIAVGPDAVYWANQGTSGWEDGAIVKVASGGGTPIVVAPQ